MAAVLGGEAAEAVSTAVIEGAKAAPALAAGGGEAVATAANSSSSLQQSAVSSSGLALPHSPAPHQVADHRAVQLSWQPKQLSWPSMLDKQH